MTSRFLLWESRPIFPYIHQLKIRLHGLSENRLEPRVACCTFNLKSQQVICRRPNSWESSTDDIFVCTLLGSYAYQTILCSPLDFRPTYNVYSGANKAFLSNKSNMVTFLADITFFPFYCCQILIRTFCIGKPLVEHN